MISLSTVSLNDWKSGVEPTCLFAFEEGEFAAAPLGAPIRKQILDLAKAEGFKGSTGQCATVNLVEKAANRKYLLAGLGKKKDYTPELLRRAAGCAFQYAKSRWPDMAVSAP